MNTKLLRQKILDLAIRGKLTDQRKSDGTAADLLKDIAEAKPKKNGVILNGARSAKSKDPKQIIPLDKSEAPFEIPDNWEWVKLGDLCNASSGKTPSTSQKEFWNGNVLWVTSKDVKQKYIDSTQICLSDLGASSMQLYPPKTMIIVGRSGILRHSLPVAILKKGATINQDLKALVFKDDRVVEFVYSVIKGMEQHLLHEYKKAGTTVDNLNFDLFLTAPIPLPPLAEQQRIVAKIEEAFAEIDAVEKNKDLLKTHIKQTRQKILDLAIHGKLVPQDENDEPASVLLEKILQEKAQSDSKKSLKKKKTDDISTSDKRPYKKNALVSAEETPFDIPNSWEWIKIKDICETFGRIGFRGYTKKDLVEKGQGAISLSPSNMIDMGLNFDKCTYISWFKYEESPEIMLNIGDIVVVKTGSSYGKNAIVDRLPEKATLNPQLMVLKQIKCNHNYLCDFLNSNYFRKEFENLVNGTAIPTFSQEKFSSKKFPLPPLAEQKRIASKIESLFSVLDAMEKESD